MRRRATFGLSALALVAGAALALALRSHERGDAPGEAAPRAAPAEADGPRLVADEGREGGAAPSPARGEPGGRWVLRGTVEGPREDEPAATVRVGSAKESDPPLPGAETGRDGRFEVDVTAAMAADPRPAALRVLVEHPAFLRLLAEVPVPEGLVPGPDGEAGLECRLSLRRAAWCAVRVTDEAEQAVPGARVAAFLVRDGQPDEWPLDEAVADRAGRVRLRVDAEAPVLLAATASGRAPGVTTLTEAARDAATLLLPAGAAIAGRVHEGGRGVPGAEISVTSDGWSGRWLHVGGEHVYWEGGEVSPDLVATRADDDGRFRVGGLPSGGYRVRVESLPDGRRPIGYERHLAAPEEGVDFDLATARVVIAVRSGGKPVAGGQVTVFAGGFGHRREIDAEGLAPVDVAAGETFQAEVHSPGCRATRVELTAPGAGARDVFGVSLEPIAPHGSIVVVLRDPGGNGIPVAGLDFWPARSGESDSAPPGGVRCGRDPRGRFVVSDLEAGRYDLRVRPGRHFDPDHTWDAGTWLDEWVAVVVPREGEAEVVVSARPGGRLRIAARDPSGAGVAARCALRDAAGEVVPLSIATRYGSGAYSRSEDVLDPRVRGEVETALAPGRYRLEVTADGFVPRTVDVEIEAGATRDADVTLEPLRGAPSPRGPLVR